MIISDDLAESPEKWNTHISSSIRASKTPDATVRNMLWHRKRKVSLSGGRELGEQIGVKNRGPNRQT